MLNALSIMAILVMSVFGSKSYAFDQTVVLNYPTPLELNGRNTLDLPAELRNQGQGSVLNGDKIVKSVRVLAKSAFGRGHMALEIGLDRVDSAIVPSAFGNDFEYDKDKTFNSIVLENRDLVGRGYDDILLSTSGRIKIIRIEVRVEGIDGNRPTLVNRLVESFRLAVGELDQEKMKTSFYGPIQCTTLAVENRDVTISEFIIEDFGGQQERISELEGFYRQNRSRRFCFRNGAQEISRIIVRGSTNPNNGGRADLKLYVESWN
jgi:hypothetical protein